MATVRLLYCDQAQGYLISRPAPAEEIEALISRGLWDGAPDFVDGDAGRRFAGHAGRSSVPLS